MSFYRRQELDEVLELIPGTVEFRLRMMEEAGNKRFQSPECPVNSIISFEKFSFNFFILVGLYEPLQSWGYNFHMCQWPFYLWRL